MQALGAALIARPVLAQSSKPMTRKIPSSAEELPAIGLGTWQTFDVGSDNAARAELAQVVKIFAAGGKLIDSSPTYGSSEPVAGDLIPQFALRDRLFIPSEVRTRGRH